MRIIAVCLFDQIMSAGDLIYFSSERQDFAGAQGKLDLYVAHVPAMFNAVVLQISTLDLDTGEPIESSIIIENSVTGKKYRSDISQRDYVIKLLINQKDFAGPIKSAKYVDLKITSKSKRYGRIKKTLRVTNPDSTDDARDKNSSLGVTLTHATKKDLDSAEIAANNSILNANATPMFTLGHIKARIDTGKRNNNEKIILFKNLLFIILQKTRLVH